MSAIWVARSAVAVLLIALMASVVQGAVSSSGDGAAATLSASPAFVSPVVTASAQPSSTPQPSIHEREPSFEPTPAMPDECAELMAPQLRVRPDEMQSIRHEPMDIYRPPGRELVAMGLADASTEGCWTGWSWFDCDPATASPGCPDLEGSTVHVVWVSNVDADALLRRLNERCAATCYLADGTTDDGATKLRVRDELLPGLGVRDKYVLVSSEMVMLVVLE